MKKRVVLIMLLAMGCVVMAEENGAPKDPLQPEYPVTGMTVIQIETILKEIKGQLPVGPKIISISFQSESKVIIQTGKVSGPLAGNGTYIIFQKIDGKWKKTEEISWLS
jgi:hypothetical protein